MTSLADRRRLLAVSAMVTFSVGYLAGIERGADLPTARFLIGTGIAFTVCSIMTDLGSGLGAGFALLIMVAALLAEAPDAFSLLGVRGGLGFGKAPKNLRQVSNQAKNVPGKVTKQAKAFATGKGN